MSLIDLLNIISKDSYILVNDEYVLGIRYNKILHCYCWCWKNGSYVEDNSDRYKIKRVILSKNVIDVKWKLKYIED